MRATSRSASESARRSRSSSGRPSSPLRAGAYYPQQDGSYLVEGGTLLRELNRKLGFSFPLDGPKTVNGLILEHLQEIPEPGTSVKIAEHAIEIVQTQDRVIKGVRIYPARASGTSEPRR